MKKPSEEDQELFSMLKKDNIQIDSDILEKAKSGDDEALYLIGELYNETGNDNKAMRWYTMSAKENNANAQYRLGLHYFHNQDNMGSSNSYNKAMVWFIKSFYNGNSEACVEIGFMYDNGLGVIQDYQLAMNWYLKAANGGNPVAKFNIGVMYEYGNGVDQNKKQALEWYQLSANQGHKIAEYKIIKLHKEGYYLDAEEKARVNIDKSILTLEKAHQEKINHLELKVKALEVQLRISEQKNQENILKNTKEMHDLKSKMKQMQQRTDHKIKTLENLVTKLIDEMPINYHNDLYYDDDNGDDENNNSSAVRCV